jgi:hypothetical protein
MRRRRFLAGGAAALSVGLAGCAHPDVVLDLTEATADEVAAEVSQTADPGSDEYRVVTAARENGTSTRRGRYDLFDDQPIVRIDDAFYDVTETRLETSEVTVYEVMVDFDAANATAERGEIAYEDLPAVDRERLEPVLSEQPPPDNEGYDLGVGYGTTAAVGNESVFVPEQQYDVLVRDGDRYRIGVESRTASQARYRYEVSEVAADVEAYADQVRDRYLFELGGLTEAERSVVEEAIDGAYFSDDDAFRSVVDRLQEHEAIRVADFYGTWLLAYDGTEYIAYAEW